jgi:FxsC-like protein
VSGTHKVHTEIGQRSSYFFLSYAHSPPLAGTQQADPDQWVRKFFKDLTDAVERHASAGHRIAPGFFDQDIPLSADWKASLTRALSAAEVFVPLYSPGYFGRSWPGREWACFRQRVANAGLADPEQRLVPVLWIPLPGEQDRPGLQQALEIGASEGAYAENGLRAMLRLRQYRASYRLVVDRLGARIVELAETVPIAPSSAPDIDDVQSEFNTDAAAAVFAVAVAAPALTDLPADRGPAGYGSRSIDWRPYPHDQKLPLAEYAARVAEQLDFAVVVAGIEKTGGLPSNMPGVILIDPWFIADGRGLSALQSFLRDLPSWVLPVPVLDFVADTRAAELTERIRVIVGEAAATRSETARHAMKGVSSLKEFVSLMPILVAEAERQYLRYGPVQRSTGRAGSRPRLAGPGWPAKPASPFQSSEENDA